MSIVSLGISAVKRAGSTQSVSHSVLCCAALYWESMEPDDRHAQVEGIGSRHCVYPCAAPFQLEFYQLHFHFNS